MQPEPSNTRPPSWQSHSGDSAGAQHRAQYRALIAFMREQNAQIVSRELSYLEAQITAGELMVESNDYRYRLDAIDAMRRTSYTRGSWMYGRDGNSSQDYIVTVDGAGDVWIDWTAVPASGVAAAGQTQPAGKRLYLRNPDAPEGPDASQSTELTSQS